MKISSLGKKEIIASLRYVLMIPVAMLKQRGKKNIWIISERPKQARDNGYCFFRYMREKHPEQRVFYLIDKKAEDYKKIEQYGNVIQFNSWKHYFYYCLAKIHISAHVKGCCPEGAIGVSKRTKRKLKFKDVFLPHGVSYGIAEFCLKKYADIDLYICSGKAEYENVLQNYGYSKEEVAYTGFPRLDYWHGQKTDKNLIVLMPTWRAYLAQNPDLIFEKTTYFCMYQELLQDKTLQSFLEDNDLHFVFYLHNEMRKYANLFQTNCPNIEIVKQDMRWDIQELLKTGAVLITDYSSVHFDFAYMRKPVIYYQFDQEEFCSKQYQKSTFSAEEDGFGPVAYNVREVILYLKESYKKDFEMEARYEYRMRGFYQLYDTHNCDRVWETIKNKERIW